MLNNEPRRRPRQRRHRLTNRRQLRPNHGRQRSIIKARDRELPGKRHPLLPGHRNNSRRGIVITGKNGRGWRRRLQQLLRANQPIRELEIAHFHQGVVNRNIGSLHLVTKPTVTLIGSTVPGTPQNEPDPHMPEIEQVPGHPARGGVIIDPHRRRLARLEPRSDPHGRNRLLGQRIQDDRMITQRRQKDDAVEAELP